MASYKFIIIFATKCKKKNKYAPCIKCRFITQNILFTVTSKLKGNLPKFEKNKERYWPKFAAFLTCTSQSIFKSLEFIKSNGIWYNLYVWFNRTTLDIPLPSTKICQSVSQSRYYQRSVQGQPISLDFNCILERYRIPGESSYCWIEGVGENTFPCLVMA